MSVYDIPNKKSGVYEVSSFTVTEYNAKIFNLRASFNPGARCIIPGT